MRFLEIIVLITVLFIFLSIDMHAKNKIVINKQRIYNDIKILTSIKPPRNYFNIKSLNVIANYIQREFRKLDCSISIQEFKVISNLYKNVIASFNTNVEERIIIGAHYDVYGDCPGADDNASGVAGLLEIARLIDKLKPFLKYRIDFIAYTLEEPPFFSTDEMGSAVHARSLYDKKVKVKLMICLEMIGYYSDEKIQEYPLGLMKWFYPKKGNFIGLVSDLKSAKLLKKFKKYMKEKVDIDIQALSSPSFLPGVDFSDHRNFWKYGYKAIMVTDTAFYRNKNYHETGDTIENLDFNRMSEVIKGVYWAIIKLN